MVQYPLPFLGNLNQGCVTEIEAAAAAAAVAICPSAMRPRPSSVPLLRPPPPSPSSVPLLLPIQTTTADTANPGLRRQRGPAERFEFKGHQLNQ